MIQVRLPAGDAGHAGLSDLATQCVEHHVTIDKWIAVMGFCVRSVRRLGLDPDRWLGRLAVAVMTFLFVLLPALALSALTRPWTGGPFAAGPIPEGTLLTWVGLALFIGVATPASLPLFRSAARHHLAWIHALVDEREVRRLAAWQHRWYSYRVVSGGAMGGALAATVLTAWLLDRAGTPAPLGSLYVGFYLMNLLLCNAVGMLLTPFETRHLLASKYKLFGLSPADSLLIRQSLRGFNLLGAISIALSAPLIVGLVLLLPAGTMLVIPVLAVLLLFEFTYHSIGALVPRLVLGQAVRRTKEEEMDRLQYALDRLLPRIDELSFEEHEVLKSLQETYFATRNSNENLLSLGIVIRTIGALLLSTITVLLSAFAQEWIADVVGRLSR